jgi:hypothetical protein
MRNLDAITGRNRTERLRDRVAMVLMLISALGALYAFVTAVGATAQAGPAAQQVEAWRTLGFAFFAGTFVLLAFWPRRYPGLWELLILDKVALTIVEAILIGNHARDAESAAIADGILSVLLIAAYFLSRGYSAWQGRRPLLGR